MAKIKLRETEFSLALLPPKGKEGWARTAISLRNEYIDYEDEGEYLTTVDVEELLTSLSRLLAGGYERAYSLSLETMGLAVDMYPPTGERPLSREERREKDCVVALRILMRSKDKQRFLDGIHTLLLHRAEVEKLTRGLREEYRENYPNLIGEGKYRFVGVSPRGLEGCNYPYFDESGEVKAGEYVWVRMGRRQIEQVVYVDSVRAYDKETAPYSPYTSKKVLRKATAQEIESYLKEWKK